jgi:hypothetical protein
MKTFSGVLDTCRYDQGVGANGQVYSRPRGEGGWGQKKRNVFTLSIINIERGSMMRREFTSTPASEEQYANNGFGTATMTALKTEKLLDSFFVQEYKAAVLGNLTPRVDSTRSL